MKIGIAISFFDFRNDMREVIKEMAKEVEVVVFGKPENKTDILKHLPANVEFRLIDERRPVASNKIVEYLYLLFRNIPRSRNNYYLVERYKIINQKISNRKKWLAQFVLNFQLKTPRLFNYDNYLNKLKYSSKTKIDDIDHFVLATEVLDDYLLIRLIDEKKSLKIYVYSWDHACKNPRFSKRAEYLTWNKNIKEDLVQLQYIPADQIIEIGASQLAYIDMFKKSLTSKPYPFPYIYFGCALGVPELALSEIEIIKELAKLLRSIHPDWRVVVRPYPVLGNWQLYDELEAIENIILENMFKTNDMSVTNENIMEKFRSIENAKAFFHLGTTLGLEACFTTTPSFIIDTGYDRSRRINLFAFIHQYQNEKYLIQPFPENCITSWDQLTVILKSIEDEKYRIPNQIIPSQIPVMDFLSFSNKLLSQFTIPSKRQNAEAN